MTTPTDNEAASFIASIQQLRIRAETAEQLAAEHETRSRIAEERLADAERRLRVAETQRDAYMRFCAEIMAHHNNLQTSLSAAGDAAARAARYTERSDPRLTQQQHDDDEAEHKSTQAIARKFAPDSSRDPGDPLPGTRAGS